MADIYDSSPRPARDRYDQPEPGTGWITFAGIMLSIVGALNVIYGVAAISDSHFYARNAHYVVSGLNAWGWALTIVGVVQVCAAFSIWARSEWGRWVGLATAGVNSIIALMILPAASSMALALFAVDILVIYGLAAYGGRQGA